jgi:thiamine-phosphate pyrophosphorylase
MTRDRARILDASANRAAEALRVMEDAARFLLDDRDLTAQLKALRHDLRALTPASHHRDATGDVGTDVTTESETFRAGARHVVAAAAKRLQESLRSLEEWSKISSYSASAAAGVRGSTQSFEQLRYRAYALEQRLLERLPRDFAGWRLCVLLSERLCARPWLDVAAAAAEAGAGCIQLREKDLPDCEIIARARALRDRLGQLAAPCDVVVNDRVDLALAAGARGVHLGQDDLPLAGARAIAGDRLIIGVSTANLEHAEAAHDADYCGVGPMFPSTTKAKPALAGPDYLRAYLERDPPLPPALAISGVTRRTLPQLVEAAGGRPFGIAVSSAVCAAPDPGAACRQLLDLLPEPPRV